MMANIDHSVLTDRPVSVDESVESVECAFELVKYGQWTLTDFEAWVSRNNTRPFCSVID